MTVGRATNASLVAGVGEAEAGVFGAAGPVEGDHDAQQIKERGRTVGGGVEGGFAQGPEPDPPCVQQGESLGELQGAAGDPIGSHHDEGVFSVAQVVQAVFPLGPDLAAGGHAGVDEHPPRPSGTEHVNLGVDVIDG